MHHLIYSILYYTILFCSILSNSTPFSFLSILLHFSLYHLYESQVYLILFCSIPFHSPLSSSILYDSTPCHSIPFHFRLSYSNPFYYICFHSIQFYWPLFHHIIYGSILCRQPLNTFCLAPNQFYLITSHFHTTLHLIKCFKFFNFLFSFSKKTQM